MSRVYNTTWRRRWLLRAALGVMNKLRAGRCVHRLCDLRLAPQPCLHSRSPCHARVTVWSWNCVLLISVQVTAVRAWRRRALHRLACLRTLEGLSLRATPPASPHERACMLSVLDAATIARSLAAPVGATTVWHIEADYIPPLIVLRSRFAACPSPRPCCVLAPPFLPSCHGSISEFEIFACNR